MRRIPSRVKRAAQRRADDWARQYPNPQAPTEQVLADVQRWVHPVADELMDLVQERPMRVYAGMMLVFVGSTLGFSVGDALREHGFDEYQWWVGVAVGFFFVVPAYFLLRPVSTQQTRARIFQYLRHRAQHQILRRRAFVAFAPPPRPDGVDSREAEYLVRDWMAYLGAPEAQVTRYRRDGGIDVRADAFVGQVKNWTGKVPVGPLRDFQGAAQPEGKHPLFFTSGTFTSDARAYARTVRMPLFIYIPRDGRLVAANPDARHVLENGLHVPLPSLKPVGRLHHAFGWTSNAKLAR